MTKISSRQKISKRADEKPVVKDMGQGIPDKPGDYFEKAPIFRWREDMPEYETQDVEETEARNLASGDAEKFFYRGLHKKYPDLEPQALKGMLENNAKFYFIFKYHEREEQSIKDLLLPAAEALSQQDARAFFYYQLHHKFPELGRGAIVQLIDTNPDSFFDLGLQKDYPDLEESANSARNIKDPNKVELEKPEWLGNDTDKPLSLRDKNAQKKSRKISKIANKEFYLPDIKGLISAAEIIRLYELEYKLFRLLSDSRPSSVKKAARAEEELSKLVNKATMSMKKIYKQWIDIHKTFLVDASYEQLENKIQEKFPDKPEILGKLSDWYAGYRTPYDDTFRLLSENIRQDAFKSGAFSGIINMYKKLSSIQSGDLRAGMALFQEALTTAHQSGPMMLHLTERTDITKQLLDDLSAGKFVDQWNGELGLKAASISARAADETEIKLDEREQSIFDILKKTIERFNLGSQLRVAGGWVRDKTIGKPSKDIDIVVDNMSGKEFANYVLNYATDNNLPIKSVGVIEARPEQSKHLETAVVNILGQDIDFVQARAERYDPKSRIPKIVAGSAVEDAYRRDFTINSLFYNINTGKVEDLTGHGIEDLKNGIIRTPVPPKELWTQLGIADESQAITPKKTFMDDPLRVLRAVRFATRLGFSLAPELIEAAKDVEVQDAFRKKISRERMEIELRKMLAGKDPVRAAELLKELNLRSEVLRLPETYESWEMDQNNPHHTMNVWEHSLEALRNIQQIIESRDLSEADKFTLNLAALLHDAGKLDPSVKGIKEVEGKITSTFHGHEEVSMRAAEHLLRNLPGIRVEEIKRVQKLIDGARRVNPQHQDASEICNMSRKALGKFVQLMGEDWEMAIDLALADMAAHQKGALKQIDPAYYRSMKEQVKGFGVDRAHEMKPIIGGDEVLQLVGRKKGGRWMGQLNKLLLDWQLENPSATKEDAKTFILQTYKEQGMDKMADISKRAADIKYISGIPNELFSRLKKFPGAFSAYEPMETPPVSNTISGIINVYEEDNTSVKVYWSFFTPSMPGINDANYIVEVNMILKKGDLISSKTIFKHLGKEAMESADKLEKFLTTTDFEKMADELFIPPKNVIEFPKKISKLAGKHPKYDEWVEDIAKELKENPIVKKDYHAKTKKVELWHGVKDKEALTKLESGKYLLTPNPKSDMQKLWFVPAWNEETRALAMGYANYALVKVQVPFEYTYVKVTRQNGKVSEFTESYKPVEPKWERSYQVQEWYLHNGPMEVDRNQIKFADELLSGLLDISASDKRISKRAAILDYPKKMYKEIRDLTFDFADSLKKAHISEYLNVGEDALKFALINLKEAQGAYFASLPPDPEYITSEEMHDIVRALLFATVNYSETIAPKKNKYDEIEEVEISKNWGSIYIKENSPKSTAGRIMFGTPIVAYISSSRHNGEVQKSYDDYTYFNVDREAKTISIETIDVDWIEKTKADISEYIKDLLNKGFHSYIEDIDSHYIQDFRLNGPASKKITMNYGSQPEFVDNLYEFFWGPFVEYQKFLNFVKWINKKLESIQDKILTYIEIPQTIRKYDYTTASDGTKQFRTKIKIDISDTEQYMKHQWLRDFMAHPQLSPKAIEVRLSTRIDERASGLHSCDDNYIEINNILSDNRDYIKETIKHELDHMMQCMMKFALYQKTDVYYCPKCGHKVKGVIKSIYEGNFVGLSCPKCKTRMIKQEPGVPGKFDPREHKMYTPESSGERYHKQHALSDIEFSPRLIDSIENMRKEVLRSWLTPDEDANLSFLKNQIRTLDGLPEEERRKLFKQRYLNYLQTDRSLKYLKEYDTAKYHKMLRELYNQFQKAIQIQAELKISERVITGEDNYISYRCAKKHESAGIFIVLPKNLAKQFKSLGEHDDSNPHVTVLFIGKVSKDQHDVIENTVKGVLKDLEPFELALDDKVTYFKPSKHSDGCKIAKMKVVSKGLQKLHKDLKKALENAGVEIDDHFPDYKPHVTLEYMAPPKEKYDDEAPSGSWTAKSVEIWGCGKNKEISFGGKKISKHAISPEDVRPVWELKREIEIQRRHIEQLEEQRRTSPQSVSQGFLDSFYDGLHDLEKELAEAEKQPQDIEGYKEFLYKDEEYKQKMIALAERMKKELVVILTEEYGYRYWFWFPQMTAKELEFWWRTSIVKSYEYESEKYDHVTPVSELPGEKILVEDDNMLDGWKVAEELKTFYTAHIHTTDDTSLVRPDGTMVPSPILEKIKKQEEGERMGKAESAKTQRAISKRAVLPYGFWLSPEGVLHPVEQYQHLVFIARNQKIFGDLPATGNVYEIAFNKGWIRLATSKDTLFVEMPYLDNKYLGRLQRSLQKLPMFKFVEISAPRSGNTGTLKYSDVVAANNFEDLNRQERCASISKRAVLPYGFWLSPEGELHQVSTWGHEDFVRSHRELFGTEEHISNAYETAFSKGWSRILFDHPKAISIEVPELTNKYLKLIQSVIDKLPQYKTIEVSSHKDKSYVVSGLADFIMANSISDLTNKRAASISRRADKPISKFSIGDIVEHEKNPNVKYEITKGPFWNAQAEGWDYVVIQREPLDESGPYWEYAHSRPETGLRKVELNEKEQNFIKAVKGRFARITNFTPPKETSKAKKLWQESIDWVREHIEQGAKDPLSKYKEKREFEKTPEPEGKGGKSGNKHRFVIQKHDAEKAGTHFDLRLENDDGAMSSWAVPKARLPKGKEKLLAQHVEDHPISYSKFEGEIEEGYGKGKVKIHDKGTYESIKWTRDTIKFKLKGKKEKGTYTLHKTDGKKWLLMVGGE